jgi:hypothetical protein
MIKITKKEMSRAESRFNPKNVHLAAANGKIIRHNGTPWRVTVQTLGMSLLASAEPFTGQGQLVNLFDYRNPLARELRGKVDGNLAS